MNVAFINPLFLFGLAGMILPILIHRITQKKVILRRFSAVHLIRRSQRITAKPQRLKHLLLLALRILAVAILAFMMARPVLIRSGSAELLKDGAMVVILDNSLSMGYSEENGKRYDGAKKAFKEILEGFGGQVLVIPTAELQSGRKMEWMRPEIALREMDRIPLSFDRGDPTAAFAAAYGMLKDLNTDKQIVILSDLARSDWETLDLSRIEYVSDTDILFFRMGGSARDPNVRVKGVRLTEESLVAGVASRLEATVSNFSDQTVTTLVQLELSDIKVDQKSIAMNAGQDARISFDLQVDTPGWMRGAIKLSTDSLAADDIFYFPLWVRGKVNVLVVDGDPKTSLRASEHYYLVSALRSGGIGDSPFTARVITEDEMLRTEMESFDALFILNAARPDPSRMSAFLEAGKPVFLFLGDRIDPEVYNRFSFVPWQIRYRIDVGAGAEKAIPNPSPGETLLSFLALGESLKKVSFHTYYKIEGAAKNILLLENNDPLMVEADVGRSKLFIFASSADLDWNDFPLSAAFLPFVQGLVMEALGRTEPSLPVSISVGEISTAEGFVLQMKDPRNGPGIYQFRVDSRELLRGVNTPDEESDLLKMPVDELKKKFGTIDFGFLEYKENSLKNLQGRRNALWPLFLILLLAVLAVEMIVANGTPRFKSIGQFKEANQAV